MKALVTGGAGFIGSHIAKRLVTDGHGVVILDNLTTGRRENIADFAEGVDFHEGDIRDLELVERLAAGCELIFHQAAVVSVPYSVEHPEQTHDVNIQGTLNVLRAGRAAGVRRVIFASSAAIYGDEPTLPKREEMVAAPISPYGVEKITGEHYCSVFASCYGLETVATRYFNVFGPRQDPSSPYSGVISIFVDRALNGGELTVFGDGEQYRDFVFVDNVVDANMRAAAVADAVGRVYNVGCGERTTLNQLLRLLGELVGRPLDVVYGPARTGDIRESVASIDRATKELGYAPRVPVRDGLRLLLDYERTQLA